MTEILEHHNAGRYLQRDVELQRMGLLAKELGEIQMAEPNVLKLFRRAIFRAKDSDDFFGIRFEVNVAATLIRNSVQFTKSESPDFGIVEDTIGLGIECTSARLREAKPSRNLYYKIEAKVNEKERKPYSSSGTALFVDITNLAFHSVATSQGLTTLLDRERLRRLVQTHSFGSIALFNFLWNNDLNRYESAYIRIDHSAIPEQLKRVLDKFIPFGTHDLGVFAISYEG
jgi:hypothetical protein